MVFSSVHLGPAYNMQNPALQGYVSGWRKVPLAVGAPAPDAAGGCAKNLFDVCLAGGAAAAAGDVHAVYINERTQELALWRAAAESSAGHSFVRRLVREAYISERLDELSQWKVCCAQFSGRPFLRRKARIDTGKHSGILGIGPPTDASCKQQ